jgi:hypothetical protein
MRRTLALVVAAVALCAFAQPAAAAPRWPRHIARDYQMFSPAGNRAVRHVVWRASRMLRAGASRGRTMGMVRRAYGRVEDTYEEAFDTAAREAFADELGPWLIAAGFDPIDSYDEFAF